MHLRDPRLLFKLAVQVLFASPLWTWRGTRRHVYMMNECGDRENWTLTCEALSSYLRTTLTARRKRSDVSICGYRRNGLTCDLLACSEIDGLVDIRECTAEVDDEHDEQGGDEQRQRQSWAGGRTSAPPPHREDAKPSPA